MKRTVIITGASSGIGAATALALASSSRLFLVARRPERLADVASKVEAAGGEVDCLALDITAEDAATQLIGHTLARFGGIDALINNAGAFATAPVDAITSEQASRLWRLNVLAPMVLTAAALPALRASPQASIITVSSVASDATFAGTAVYAGSKAAIEAWSRVVREELRAYGIRVGVVVPGATDTEVWGPACTFDRTRMCRSTDIAEAIRFMLDAPMMASIDRMVVTPRGGAL